MRILHSVIMTYSFAQLLEIFPDAVPAVKRAIKARHKELKKSIAGLSDFRDLWTRDINNLDFTKQPAYIEYLNDLIARLEAGYEKEIRKCEYELSYIENLKNPEAAPKGDPVDDLRIARAKSFPIRDLLEVKRGVTLCLWHDDHRPSMKVYDDHVYCFSCNKNADAIDIYMALNGCDFRTAVRALAP